MMNIVGILYIVCYFLLLPCTIVTALVLLMGKGKANKGLWCAASVLSTLSCFILAIIDLVAQVQAFPNPGEVLRLYLPRVMLPMLCFLPVTLYPLVCTTGRKGGWKPLLLVPALIASFVRMISAAGLFNGLSFQFKILLYYVPIYFPLMLMMLLAAVWYYTGKKPVLGIAMGLYGLLCLMFHPILCASIGVRMIYMPGKGELFAGMRMLLRSVSNNGMMNTLSFLRASSFPLAGYAVMSILTIAGLHSKRLPKETEVVPAAVPARPQMPQAVPAAPTKPAAPQAAAHFCTQCGSKLDAGDKFCTKCGTRV